MKKYIKFEYLIQKRDSALCLKKEMDNLTDIFLSVIKGFGFYTKAGGSRLEDETPQKKKKEIIRTGETLVSHNKTDTYKTTNEIREMYDGNYFEERVENIFNLETKICRTSYKIALIEEEFDGTLLWLKEKGFENVTVFPDSTHALDRIDATFKLVLSKYHLKDGIAAIKLYRELKEKNVEIPFIITGGHTEFEYNNLKKHKYVNLLILPPNCSSRVFEEVVNRLYVKFLDGWALI